MNLHHLLIFCTVVNHRSFARAAEALHISQPAISQQIQKLEDSLGKTLIERRGRLFRVTSHGDMLYEYGKRIFSMVEEAEQAFLRVGRHRERIAVGTSPIPGTYFLPDFIVGFQKNFPHTQFEVYFEEDNHLLLDRLIRHQVDVVITYESVILRDEIQALRIMQDDFVLALPGKHPWASGQVVTIEEVLTLPFVFHRANSLTQLIMESVLTGHYVNATLQLGRLEAVKTAISRGLGVSMLPLSSMRFEVTHGLLAVANCTALRVPRHLVLLYRHGTNLPDVVQRSLDFLRDGAWQSRLTAGTT